jgi:2-polyprenyl-3-methyl-5-hydroxy-6-metoxy-1,4-benzoquinol methylase
MYISPMVHFSDRLRSDMYNLEYFNAEMKNMGEKRRNLRIAARHMRGGLNGKRLLDIGCGTGEYLFVGREFGMDVTGMDVDETIVKHLRAKHGFRAELGLWPAELFPARSFDLVVLSHVIEHLQEPERMLASIRAVMKPDGLLLVAMPNANSLEGKLHELYSRMRRGREKTFILTPFTTPFHILGFNLKSARRLIGRAGFTPVYAKVRSGLEWEDTRFALAMKAIKVAGLLIGRGMSLVTISRLT